MANLPLRTRRDIARGFGTRTQRAWARRRFIGPGIGRRGSLTVGTGNNAVVYYAKAPGTAGNSITVAQTAAGTASQPTSVSVTGNAITVTLGTNASTVVNATPAQVVDAINRHVQAELLVWAQQLNDAPGTAVAVAATALAGGTAPA